MALTLRLSQSSLQSDIVGPLGTPLGDREVTNAESQTLNMW